MGVYGYVRVSTAQQVNKGNSLEEQERKIHGQAAVLGKKVDQIFAEKGVSGSVELAKRPQGRALLKTVLHQKGHVIIAAKLDRMFRSAVDALNVSKALRKNQTSLYLLNLGSDDVTAGEGVSWFMLTVMSGFAELEKTMIQERIQEVIEARRRKHLHLGGVRPFGFTVDPTGKLQPAPKEQRAIRMIKRLRERKHSLREIAQRVKEVHGLPLSHMTVKAVLRREAFKVRTQPS